VRAKGIRYSDTQDRWLVSLWYDNKDIHLGSYRTFGEAVRAKRKKADLFRLDLSDMELFGCPMSALLDPKPVKKSRRRLLSDEECEMLRRMEAGSTAQLKTHEADLKSVRAAVQRLAKAEGMRFRTTIDGQTLAVTKHGD
jgi:hypothetical protein